MRILLRVDATRETGVGHLVRSMAVAEHARNRGHEVLVCGSLDVEWADQQATEAGLSVVPVPTPATAAALAELAEHEDCQVVHVDCYDIGADDADLREALHTKAIHLINVEDGQFGRRPADLVIDPTVGAERRERPADGSGVLALGSAYVPLRPSVLVARDRRKDRAGGLGDRPRVLVVMGGTDPGGALVGTVEALVKADVSADVLAVSPTPGPGLRAEAMSTRTVRVLATPVRSDLPRLFADHDLVVCASGTTVWELCCIGTPMAVLHVTENQRLVHDGLVEAGAALGLGGPADLDRASGRLRSLLRDGLRRMDLAAAAAALVDGGGAGRVVDLVEAVVAGDAEPWQLRARLATADDADRLLAWRNDPATRLASREQDVVSRSEHDAWLAASLGRRDRLLLVVEDIAGAPVGTVRWDRLGYGDPRLPLGVEADWEVSITVAPERRGSGVSRPVLAEAERFLAARTGPDRRLLARVHQDNHASQRLFESAGFAREDRPADDLGFLTYLNAHPS
jgi:spore coat polysaccharide biosynthesis predicted glycosyltransferase SpsG/RimJ/RimL family protein N-acetyltransferase